MDERNVEVCLEIDLTLKGLCGRLESLAPLFGLAVDAGDLVVWVWDLQSGKVTLDHKATMIWPSSVCHEGCVVSRWEQLVHPENLYKIQDAREKLASADAFIVEECRIPDRKKADSYWEQWAWISIRGRVVSLDGTSAERVMGVLRDVTTEKRHNEYLALWEEIPNGVYQGVWRTDCARDFVRRGAQWYNMLGYAQDEIPPTRKGAQEIIHPDDKTEAKKRMDKILSFNGKGLEPVFRMEYRLRTKSGTYKWVTVWARVMERAPKDRKALRLIGMYVEQTDPIGGRILGKRLYEVAVFMTKDRNIQAKLDKIVATAVDILNTDVSTITLFDRMARIAYVGAGKNLTSQAFRELKVPFGIGLGEYGLYEEEGLCVSNYLSDTRFNHQPWLDAAWRAEGLVSALMVPINIDEHGSHMRLGRLWVMNRHKTDFTSSHRHTLSLVANLAAVELARHAEDQRYKSLYELAKTLTRGGAHGSRGEIEEGEELRRKIAGQSEGNS